MPRPRSRSSKTIHRDFVHYQPDSPPTSGDPVQSSPEAGLALSKLGKKFHFIDNGAKGSISSNSTKIRRHVMKEYMREKRWVTGDNPESGGIEMETIALSAGRGNDHKRRHKQQEVEKSVKWSRTDSPPPSPSILNLGKSSSQVRRYHQQLQLMYERGGARQSAGCTRAPTPADSRCFARFEDITVRRPTSPGSSLAFRVEGTRQRLGLNLQDQNGKIDFQNSAGGRPFHSRLWSEQTVAAEEIERHCEDFITFLQCTGQLAQVQAGLQYNIVEQNRQPLRYSTFKPGQPLYNLLARTTEPGREQEELVRLTALMAINAAIWEYRHSADTTEAFLQETLRIIQANGYDNQESLGIMVQTLIDGSLDPALLSKERPVFVRKSIEVARNLERTLVERLNALLLQFLTLGPELRLGVGNWQVDMRSQILRDGLRGVRVDTGMKRDEWADVLKKIAPQKSHC